VQINTRTVIGLSHEFCIVLQRNGYSFIGTYTGRQIGTYTGRQIRLNKTFSFEVVKIIYVF
jgi:hypothetical protein